MIGQRVSATVWSVMWQYTAVGAGERDAPVQGRQVFITADPSGADVLDVASSVVLAGKATPAHQFRLLECSRVADVQGLAMLPAEDRGWPALISTGSALLEATSRHAAAMHDLGKQLLLERSAREALEDELDLLRGVADGCATDPLLAQRFRPALDQAGQYRRRAAALDAMAESRAGHVDPPAADGRLPPAD